MIGTGVLEGDRVPGYTLTRRIASGSVAAVFEAEHLRTGRRTALKVMRVRRETPGWMVEAFRREASLQSRCRSPHVVAVHEAGSGDGCLYIALERLPGADLQARLADGPLDEVAGLALARDVARALSDVAGAGVLHGDVKPANLLAAGGSTKLADFGAARPLDRPRVAGQPSWLGTLPYVAPEEVLARSPWPEHHGRPIDERADLYSLGITLFVALTGASPTCATHPREFIRWILREEVPDPRLAAPDLSPRLAELIRDLTRSDPDRRPPSARALCARLDEGSIQKDTAAPAPPPQWEAPSREP